MLSLHLLQVCLVCVNTLMIQQVLSEPEWQNRLTGNFCRGLAIDRGVFSLGYGILKPDCVARTSRAVVGATDRITYSPRPADESHRIALAPSEPSWCSDGA
jgi:hypothetical protein